MKTPLLLLVTTIILAGCSSSAPVATENPRDQLPQSEQEYLESVNALIEKEYSINKKATDSLDIDQCEKLESKDGQLACKSNVIMVMSAQGDKSLCEYLTDEQDKEECFQ